MYWWKKDLKGISPIYINRKNNRIITVDPKRPYKIFSILKFKIKYISEKNIKIIEMYPVGVCFVKNDRPRIIGSINHQILFCFLSARRKQKTPITDRYEAWWSTYGVPDEGYDKKDKNSEYKKQNLISKLNSLRV